MALLVNQYSFSFFRADYPRKKTTVDAGNRYQQFGLLLESLSIGFQLT